MSRLRIISDGIHHRVETEEGTPINNVQFVRVLAIAPGEPVRAQLELVNVPIDIVAERAHG